MKKSYLMIAAAAALLTACSNSEKLTNELSQPTQKDRIGFASYSEKTTRGDDANSVKLEDFYDTFDVYAWKTVGTTPAQEVFKHTPVAFFDANHEHRTYVYASTSPSTEWGTSYLTDYANGWLYENVRYWDKLADSYEFFAIAPYEATPDPALTVASGATNIAIGTSNDKYDISNEKNLAINPNITNEKKYFVFTKDYMLAEKSDTKNQLVTLNFKHILTKLNIKITIQDTYKGIQSLTINKLEIAGLKKEGYYTATDGWTTNGSYSKDITADYCIANPANNGTNYSGYYWFQTLVFPQTFTCASNEAQQNSQGLTQYLYIKYTIGTEIFEAYYDLTYAFNNNAVVADQNQGINATTFELIKGTEYTLNIKVGPAPIVFDAVVDDWDDGAEHEHVVY